jgi:hypothetical protein
MLTRNAVRALGSPDALAAPTETWRTALQERGLLDDRAALPAGERQAVDLLDALHPWPIRSSWRSWSWPASACCERRRSRL